MILVSIAPIVPFHLVSCYSQLLILMDNILEWDVASVSLFFRFSRDLLQALGPIVAFANPRIQHHTGQTC